ncbi:MAG: NAD(+)/NADH kinase [Gemmatimonadaceae bacterium]
MRIGVVGNRRYAGLASVLATLRRRAQDLGLTFFFESELSDFRAENERLDELTPVDALLTLGGDGTMLRGARLVAGRPIPILGVNLGRLGFLTTCGLDALERAIERMAARDFVVERRMALTAACPGGGADRRWHALNDVVLHKGGFARVVHLRVSVDEELIGAYAADGLIVSTPTGSTAYSLSAGGPVVVPTFESIIITPISAHTLAVRPLVLPGSAEIEVRADDGPDQLLITIDGQVGATFSGDDTLFVRRAQEPVLMVRFSDSLFFARMRRKLGWGGLRERDESDLC